ncbi:MAG: hypothetical protein JSS21_07740 [Proteobacteria bacterium]|nr:hypothetical protein [Pseudomonadota bacterium]
MRSAPALPFAILFSALTAATVTTASAGTTGNGWSRPNSTSYAYCYGGNNHVEYFSRVFQVVPPATSEGAGGFGNYLTKMGYANDGGQCRSGPTMASATAGKQESENTFQSAEYHHRKIVETDWAGG